MQTAAVAVPREPIVDRYVAEAPRMFVLTVIEVELIEVGDSRRARVTFGHGEKRPVFHRDFPTIESPRVGDRWTVSLQPEARPMRTA